MKRLIIGDVHGLFNIVGDIYNKEKPDKVIILGDYFDSFTIAPIIQNIGFRDLMTLRKNHIESNANNKSSFIMLIGNHDAHYLVSWNERYSGYNYETEKFASEYMNHAIDYETMQMIYIDEDNHTIYSHAGITNAWLKTRCNNASLFNVNTLAFEYFKFTYRDNGNMYGSSIYNSPLWVRPNGLLKDPYKDDNGIIWNQVYGHTHQHYAEKILFDEAEFYNLDCLPYQYMIEEIDDKTNLILKRIIKDIN